MRYTLLTIGVLTLASTCAGVAAAADLHHVRHTVVAPQHPSSFQPPRMIEVRPGQWESTYDECGDPCDGGY